MSARQTRQVISAYFDALETGQFARYFTDDVTWTTIANDTHVQGPDAVEAAINALHARLKDLQTRQLVIGEDAAYIEGSAAGVNGQGRIPYCVAYDVVGDRVGAMRAYGDIAEFMPRPS
jgi:hypothetical protein